MDDLEDLSRRSARPQNGVDPTRMKPEPWFVGSGEGLKTLILVIVAVLIVVRIVSTFWLADDAWRWWSRRASVAPASQTVPTITSVERIDVNSAPANLRSPTVATPAMPVDDEAAWITTDDYPVASLRADEQGTTSIRWVIDTRGRVSRCGTLVSSGYPRLDAAACHAIMRSGRYTPARAADGSPIATTMTRRVVWRLPD